MTEGVPSRLVVQAEALAWLDANRAGEHASVITSLPDVSEISGFDLDAWRAWFVASIRRIIRWVPPEGVAIFYQSDIRHRGSIVDKGYLVVRAAEEEGAALLWHKIVCRKPAGTISFGRPTYSHMIAVGVAPRAVPRHPGPDVLPDAGIMSWSRATGVEACRVACDSFARTRRRASSSTRSAAGAPSSRLRTRSGSTPLGSISLRSVAAPRESRHCE